MCGGGGVDYYGEMLPHVPILNTRKNHQESLLCVRQIDFYIYHKLSSVRFGSVRFGIVAVKCMFI